MWLDSWRDGTVFILQTKCLLSQTYSSQTTSKPKNTYIPIYVFLLLKRERERKSLIFLTLLLCQDTTLFPFQTSLIVFTDKIHFQVHKKLSGKSRDFSYTSCSHTSTTFPTIYTLPHRGTFVTINKPTLTRHHQPKSVVYIRAHSRGWMFYRF